MLDYDGQCKTAALLYWCEIWLRVLDEAALDRAVTVAYEGRPAYERFVFKQGMGRYKRWVIGQGFQARMASW